MFRRLQDPRRACSHALPLGAAQISDLTWGAGMTTAQRSTARRLERPSISPLLVSPGRYLRLSPNRGDMVALRESARGKLWRV